MTGVAKMTKNSFLSCVYTLWHSLLHHLWAWLHNFFDQCDINKHYTNRSLKTTCAWRPALLLFLQFNCHVKKPTLAWLWLICAQCPLQPQEPTYNHYHNFRTQGNDENVIHQSTTLSHMDLRKLIHFLPGPVWTKPEYTFSSTCSIKAKFHTIQ